MEVSCQLIRSARKTISLQITPKGEVLVRCPNRMPRREVEAFLRSREAWICSHLARFRAQPALPVLTPEELASLAEEARKDLSERLRRFAPRVGVDYGRITIRCQHTRWGSCSSRGNLNFNCLLMLCPPEVRDYVVVHELCHRKELNHSPKFWAEVEKVLPDYAAQRAWLKGRGGSLIRRLPEKGKKSEKNV